MDFKESINSLRHDQASNLQYAELYLKLGFALIPCHFIKPTGNCSCNKKDCTSPGKHPLVPKGLKDASHDPEVLKLWFSENPKANIAIVTGRISGVSVLDFDEKSGGVDLYLDFLDDLDYFQNCLKAKSGGNGIHCFFKYRSEPKTRAGLIPGMDVRNDGGYILVEPSNHISGGVYQWIL
jgi:hypothetical protein